MTRKLAPLFVLLLTACGQKSEPHAATPATQGPSAARTTPPVAAAAPAAPPIARDRVDATIARWLELQNTGKFDEYATLYATRFDGLRRNGERTKRFDRAGWLEDRQRMFARPMHVEIESVTVRSTPSTATVDFIQRWSSGTYADQGMKRIVLVPNGTKLEISSEEMLDSQRLEDVEANIVNGMFSTLDTRAGTLVVLGNVDAARGKGALRLVRTSSDIYVSFRDVADTGIAPQATALVGTNVHLITATGSCTARIDSLGVAGIVIPHFGDAGRFQGQDEEGNPGRPMAPSAIAAEVDAMAESHWLVGVTRSTCGETVAAARNATAPVVFTRAPASPEVVAEVFRKLRAGAPGTALATRMREGLEAAGEGDGDAVIDDAAVEAAMRESLEVVVYTHDAANVVVASLQVPGDCGGSTETFLFEREGASLVAREIESNAVSGVFDVTGDGVPEAAVRSVYGTHRGVRRLGDRPGPIVQWSMSYLDCPC